MSRKKILVCGAGSIGQRHIRNLLDLGHDVIDGTLHDLRHLDESEKLIF